MEYNEEQFFGGYVLDESGEWHLDHEDNKLGKKQGKKYMS
jgi:hypothetical protein